MLCMSYIYIIRIRGCVLIIMVEWKYSLFLFGRGHGLKDVIGIGTKKNLCHM